MGNKQGRDNVPKEKGNVTETSLIHVLVYSLPVLTLFFIFLFNEFCKSERIAYYSWRNNVFVSGIDPKEGYDSFQGVQLRDLSDLISIS